jgi:2-oxo-4-hydroxy-4-carboxy-5-ureidoimidazoline decarboxylase
MPVSIAELDTMPADSAAELLTTCCGSKRWVTRMLARRPFGSRDELTSSGETIWQELTPADWIEAFGHHPRIGARDAQGLAREEQSAMTAATATTRAALAELNREYEQRFGYIYIVCATGRSADQLFTIAQSRLLNPPGVELATAALEQQKITRLRLEKLVQ